MRVQITFTVDVDGATRDEIDSMVANAAVQIEEPADDLGDDVEFTTRGLEVSWVELEQ